MLWNYMKIDFKRAFLNWKCIIVILVVYGLLQYNNIENTNVISWIYRVFSVQFIIISMAVASATYATSIIDERNHKYKMLMIVRGNPVSYILSKIVVIFISTIITFFVAFCLAAFVNYIRYGLPDADTLNSLRDSRGAYLEMVYDQKFIGYVVACALQLSFFAGVMSLIGVMISLFFRNRIIVYCFPVIMVYIDDIFMERTFGWEKAATRSLKYLVIDQICMKVPGQSVPLAYIQMACYAIILGYFIIYVSKRKLDD